MTGSPTNDDVKVSVIMPAYNSGRFIRQALDSALTQSFRSIEVVVIDDGSTERVDWVTDLDPGRVRYHWKKNGGPASARNEGARQARGDFLAFLDADDVWDPTKLERQVAALESRPQAAFSYAAFRGIDEAGNAVPRPVREQPSGDVIVALFMYNFITTSSVVVRRACFEEMRGFDESLVWSEDYDLWIRLAERHEAVSVAGTLGSYRTNQQGLSRNFVRMYETERQVIDRTIARNARPEVQRRLPERLGNIHFEFGYEYLINKRFREARHQFLQSIRRWPWNRRYWLYCARAALGGLRATGEPARR